MQRCHCTRQSSNPYSVLHSIVLMPSCVTSRPLAVLNIIKPRGLLTLSGSNVIAQVSWEHATCCTTEDGRFNLFESFNRFQVSTLFLNVVDVLLTSFLNVGQSGTMLEFCQPFTMFFKTLPANFPIRHDVLRNFSNFPTIHSTRHGAHHPLDPSRCSW